MLELSFVVIRDLVLDLEPFWFVKVVSGYWTISSICYTSMSHFTFQLNCEIMLVCNHPVCWLSGVNNLLLCKIGSCLFAGVCLSAGHGRSEYKWKRILLCFNKFPIMKWKGVKGCRLSVISWSVCPCDAAVCAAWWHNTSWVCSKVHCSPDRATNHFSSSSMGPYANCC